MCPPGYECPFQDQAVRCEKRIIIHLLREKHWWGMVIGHLTLGQAVVWLILPILTFPA